MIKKSHKLLLALTVGVVSIVPVYSIMKVNPMDINSDVNIFMPDYKLYETTISSVNVDNNEEIEFKDLQEYYIGEGNQLIEKKLSEIAHVEQKQFPQSKQDTLNNDTDASKVEEVPKIKQPNNQNLGGYLNSYILDAIKTYNGKHPYLLDQDYENYNGVTTTLFYQDKILLKAHPSGNRASHCSGITFEVFYKAMQRRNEVLGIPKDDIKGMSYDQVQDFILHWYAAQGPKSSSNITVAVQKYGLGISIKNLEDARPGDFIDFSRENNTGHTAVFLNWIFEGDKIVGLKYWSSQSTTGGIAYKTEYFNVTKPDGKTYGNVRIDQLYIARIYQ